MVKHVFLARWTNKSTPEFELDAMVTLQWPEDRDVETADDLLAMVRGEKRFGGITEAEKKQVSGVVHRARHQEDLVPGGPFVVNADMELTRKEIESYVRHLPSGKRRSFFEDASLFS